MNAFRFSSDEGWRAAEAPSPIDGMNCGGTRTCVSCSNAYARAISVGSSQRPPMKDTPTGSGPTKPAGTVTFA